MDMIPYIPGLCLVLNERHHGLKFIRAPTLESRRIVEDEPWVALEGKFITNVVDSSLWHQISFMITEIHKDHGAGTSTVGLICRKKNDKKISSETGNLPYYKLDPPVYCRPA